MIALFSLLLLISKAYDNFGCLNKFKTNFTKQTLRIWSSGNLHESRRRLTLVIVVSCVASIIDVYILGWILGSAINYIKLELLLWFLIISITGMLKKNEIDRYSQKILNWLTKYSIPILVIGLFYYGITEYTNEPNEIEGPVGYYHDPLEAAMFFWAPVKWAFITFLTCLIFINISTLIYRSKFFAVSKLSKHITSDPDKEETRIKLFKTVIIWAINILILIIR